MDWARWNIRRFKHALRCGDIERVRELLGAGIDPNIRDQRGRPAIIRAVRALIPESGVVDALLDAGADPDATDASGLTALDYARRRLAKLGNGPDRVTKSQCLDRHGNLVLDEDEKALLDQVRREVPSMADEFTEIYMQERRKAALRQFRPRRELRIIIKRLESIPIC